MLLIQDRLEVLNHRIYIFLFGSGQQTVHSDLRQDRFGKIKVDANGQLGSITIRFGLVGESTFNAPLGFEGVRLPRFMLRTSGGSFEVNS